MILMFGGDWIFSKIGIVPPAIYYRMKNNQMIVIIASMFIGNSISGSLLSTGAFEVYLDNKLIFSKLRSGLMPNIQDIDGFLAA